MFVLWKDHTAVKEAEEINRVARSWGGTDFTKYEGGIYSVGVVLGQDPPRPAGRQAGAQGRLLLGRALRLDARAPTGNTDPLAMKRSRCAAGHKAMWHAEWGGLPTEEFLRGVDPLLGGLRARLYKDT